MDYNSRQVTIWDLDNCLSNDSWRIPRIDWHLEGNERYRRYNEYAHLDRVHYLDKFVAFKMVALPVFFSGRPEYMREQTRVWIEAKLGVKDPVMYLRPNDSPLSPADLKHNMVVNFKDALSRTERIIAAFDDLPAVVEMYHWHQIPAVVLAIHSGYAAYQPQDLTPANI